MEIKLGWESVAWICVAAIFCCFICGVTSGHNTSVRAERDIEIHREAQGGGTQQETVTQTRKVERL